MSYARRFSLLIGVAAGALATVAAPPDAGAQARKKSLADADRIAARDAYDRGTAAFEKGDYVGALDNYARANGIIPSPHAMYWMARSLDKLGRNEEAIRSYREVLGHSDVAKIGDDKIEMARARLAALEAPPEPESPTEGPPATPAAEPPPPAAPPPPPAEETHSVLPLHHDDDDLKPQKNLIELGLLTGPVFISNSHNLHDESFPHSEYSTLAWWVGLRAAFFPAKVVGFEVEWAHGWGSVRASPAEPGPSGALGVESASAQFDTVRGHLVGQLGGSRLVPFALLGAGLLHVGSDSLGSDTDFLLEAGVGAKVAVTKIFMPRLDLRLGATQKEGGGFSDGVAFHPEILLGASFTLGR